MASENIANEIVSLVRRFHELGNVSPYELLEEAGYFQMYADVSEEVIRNELSMYPDFIKRDIEAIRAISVRKPKNTSL